MKELLSDPEKLAALQAASSAAAPASGEGGADEKKEEAKKEASFDSKRNGLSVFNQGGKCVKSSKWT